MEVKIGWHSNEMENPPEIGSVMTVKHSSSYHNGILRHAFFWKSRPDLKWKNISNKSRVLVFDI